MANYNLDPSLTATVVNSFLLYSLKHPHCAVLDSTASITLPTTPSVYKAPTVSSYEDITYDTGTGVFTFPNTDVYHLSLLLNAQPSANNKNIYFYAEANTGAGWVIQQYSAREKTLASSSATEQIVITTEVKYVAGTQIRFYVWGDATMYLKTTDLPGTTAGTVTLAASRILWGK